MAKSDITICKNLDKASLHLDRLYHNFTSELLVELNTIRAAAAGAAALAEQIADDAKVESAYVQELMHQVRRQLDALATKIDGATYAYIAKA